MRYLAERDCEVTAIVIGGVRRQLERPIPMKRGDIMEFVYGEAPKLILNHIEPWPPPKMVFDIEWIELG